MTFTRHEIGLFRHAAIVVLAFLAFAVFATMAKAQTTILNVSYDPTRELYSDQPGLRRHGRPRPARR